MEYVIQRKEEELNELLLQFKILQKEFLTLEEASIYLQVSKSFLYKLTSRNEIAHFKPSGKLIYFSREDLDNWIRAGKVASLEECSGEMYSFLSVTRKPSIV